MLSIARKSFVARLKLVHNSALCATQYSMTISAAQLVRLE